MSARSAAFLALEELIAAGWGDVPQVNIPADWRERKAPLPAWQHKTLAGLRKPPGRPKEPIARQPRGPRWRLSEEAAQRIRKKRAWVSPAERRRRRDELERRG